MLKSIRARFCSQFRASGNANGLKIDICFCYGYFEVFGLNNEEFKELNDYYIKLGFESEEK